MFPVSPNLLAAFDAGALYEKLQPAATWLTVAVVALIVLAGTAVFFSKRAAFKTFLKVAFFGFFVYLFALLLCLFSLDIARHYSDAYTEENWLDKEMLVKLILIPLSVFSLVALLSLAAFALSAKFRPSAKKYFAIVGGILSAVALAVSLACIACYYRKKIENDGYYNSDTASVKQLALYISALLLIAAIGALTFLEKGKLSFDTKSLAYAGICVSMSFALSYIRLWKMPQGGSITLASLLPLMIYSYLFGLKKGVFAGFVYGILQAVQDPWLIHPAQFLLDYPVAFAAIGLAGIFRHAKFSQKLPQLSFALGAIVSGLLRFASHVLSGVFAFSAYAQGQNPWAYSLAYNSFVFIDVAIVIVAGALVFSSKSFVKTMRAVAPSPVLSCPSVPSASANPTDSADSAK